MMIMGLLENQVSLQSVRNNLRHKVALIPGARPAMAAIRRHRFPGSARYWEQRYAQGGNSGAGSYGELARFKADVLNDLVLGQEIGSVIEFGCGDGAQLQLARYPKYIGLDISPTILKSCAAKFSLDDTKSFFIYDPRCFFDRAAALRADLALSLDVIYHLTEDHIYDLHMRHLFSCAQRFVAIYASNEDRFTSAPHVRHRQFSEWVAKHEPQWRLHSNIRNPHPLDEDGSGSFADFFIYAKTSEQSQEIDNR